MRYRRQSIKPNPIVEAQKELNDWYLEHLAFHTYQDGETHYFLNPDSKSNYEWKYQDKIQQLIIKYGIHSNELTKSIYDVHDILLDGPVGITIESVEIDERFEPSEETKESEPEPFIEPAPIPKSEPEISQHVLRIQELWEHIKDCEIKIREYKDEISTLEIYYN